MAVAADPLAKIRRFYKDVSVVAEESGFAVKLDGRGPRTPGGAPLRLPTWALAELVAGEWRSQGDQINPLSMAATRLANTALDVVHASREASVEAVTRFAGVDLLCYFAQAPASLVRRQEKHWGPLLAWAAEARGLPFTVTSGVVHVDQPAGTLARLKAELEALDDFTLAGLAFAAALFGSAILALALADGRLAAEEAMACARLDEIFQEEQWGVDAEAASRAEAMAAEAVMAQAWFAALR